MHTPNFTFRAQPRRALMLSLAISSLVAIGPGCQQKASEAPVEPAPAAKSPSAGDASEPQSPQAKSPQAPTASSPTASTPDPSSPASQPQPNEDGGADGDSPTQPMGKLQLQPPPKTDADPAPTNASSETASADSSAEESESPNVGDATEEDDYEIDPEILAHIEAQKRALRRIADTYAAPPEAKQLGKQPDLWVDMNAKRVYVDGYVTMRRGPLEMFACPIGTKEHESVVAVFAKSSEVHAALLAIGAQSGTPVRWNPEFLPPTGQTISVWVAWRSPEPSSAPEPADDSEPASPQEFVPSDEFHVADARKWVRNMKTQTELEEPWVFAGSMFWSDPEDDMEHYSADAGDMICVSNFSSAMLDVPFNSSADAGSLLFEPFSDRIPERGTPVRLVLVPQPIPRDEPAPPQPVDPTTAPDQAILPIADSAPKDAAVTTQ
ncbi:YdjY domain-containing protein [Allorhodopirellula solitaria]|uniref:SLA1 homology domain-containing protein n=1 Tax=Allorhodopirellula solitaria TaxID=2527987 RepID=A0A5C5X1N7_9BACT|nr:YdjY domain-containing protein [Allorhodopirellula solitaria]TWT56142.1 hypothetical protein CA85_44840 [Allorhodopirellula solitaria]